jgi:hypothetical protein
MEAAAATAAFGGRAWQTSLNIYVEAFMNSAGY